MLARCLHTFSFRFLAIFVASAISAPAYSAEQVTLPFTVDAGTPGRDEASLTIQYQLHCDGQAYRSRGVIDYGGRKILLDFFNSAYGAGVARASLGRAIPANAVLNVTVEPGCVLNVRSMSVRYASTPSGSMKVGEAGNPCLPVQDDSKAWKALAILNSPFLVERIDQASNAATDLPLAIAYSVHEVEGHSDRRILRYTMFFSDEDSETKSKQIAAQMARYGRSADIEWLYEVELDKAGKVVARRYQGDLIGGIGHKTRNFNGSFLSDSNGGSSQHPILYNIANHNVFSDEAKGAQKDLGVMGHHLVPLEEIHSPDARENVMFRHPWLFDVSAAEANAEGKGGPAPEAQVYVEMGGKIQRGSFKGVVTLADGSRIQSGGGEGNVDRLGEDLWNQRAYTAIPIGPEAVKDLLTRKSTATFSTDASFAFKGRVEALRYYVFFRDENGLHPVDVTDRFK